MYFAGTLYNQSVPLYFKTREMSIYILTIILADVKYVIRIIARYIIFKWHQLLLAYLTSIQSFLMIASMRKDRIGNVSGFVHKKLTLQERGSITYWLTALFTNGFYLWYEGNYSRAITAGQLQMKSPAFCIRVYDYSGNSRHGFV